MGYYIEVPNNHNKANQIAELYGGEIIPCPSSFLFIPLGKALICVMDNGPFEAAGFCYNEREFREFACNDGRSKQWVLIDWDVATKLTGFTKH